MISSTRSLKKIEMNLLSGRLCSGSRGIHAMVLESDTGSFQRVDKLDM